MVYLVSVVDGRKVVLFVRCYWTLGVCFNLAVKVRFSDHWDSASLRVVVTMADMNKEYLC